MCTWSGGGCTWSQEGVPAWSGGVYLPGPGGVPGQVLPPVDRMTHTYENITLPQTSFAGGNNRKRFIYVIYAICIATGSDVRTCLWIVLLV